jgi:non-specific serine/threonine protein kinase
MSGAALRREMLCILHSDIVSSTPESVRARRSGEEAARSDRLQRFLDRCHGCLEAGGATFLKTLGDGLLATFPDPVDALRAALEAHRALQEETGFRDLPLRVGLHAGTVSVQGDGDILGADAALAERVMQAARPGEIVVSEAFAALVRPYLSSGQTLADQGAQRLKGFAEPVRLFSLRNAECGLRIGDDGGRQTADGGRRTADGTAKIEADPSVLRPSSSVVPNPQSAFRIPQYSLPAPPDRFIGRRRERSELRRLLADPARRCITLLGVGGCGKTRLALEVARDLRPQFRDGVYFVPLEEAVDAGGVLTRIAAALGLAAGPQTDLLLAVQAALHEKQVLLVLDNFEQALAAAGTVAALLASLPALRLLVTSREPLRLRGERVYDLDPLGVPLPGATPRQIQASESVRLFVDRVQATNRRFRLGGANAAEVAGLCREVAGLPLALELLAAEARYRPLAALCREVRAELLHRESELCDTLDRQRSLRAAFDWSYRLLSEPERQLLCELGLFETAFGEAEAGEVCSGGEVRSGLRRLCDRSLVTGPELESERPYRLLVPVRQYARFRLGTPDEALRQRFIAAFTRRAERLREAYLAREVAAALRGLQADLENFRAAWNLALAAEDPARIADLGMAVTFFAPHLPGAANLEGWLDPLAAALERLGNDRRLSRLANTRARLAGRHGDFARAIAYQQEALRRLHPIGTEAELADQHSTLALMALRGGDLLLAEHHARLGQQSGQQAGDSQAEAQGLFVLASVLAGRDPQGAAEMAERSLALFREQAERNGMAHASLVLAAIAEKQGDPETAAVHYRNALGCRWEHGAQDGIARCLEQVGAFYQRQGELDLAAELLTAAAGAQRWLGVPETARRLLPPECRPAEEPLTLAAAVDRVLSTPVA